MDIILSVIFHKKIIAPILIIITTWALIKLLSSIINRLFTKDKSSFEMKKRTTIIELATKVIKFFLYCIAILMILNIYGIDTQGIIASLGIASVILGLALQDTVQDLMSGISIIIDNYYAIGDMITINGFTGEVLDVTLKSTKVKSYSGEVYIFANRNVDAVINLSQSRAGVKIVVPSAYEEKISKVETALKDVVESAKKLEYVDADSTYMGIDKLDENSVNHAIIIYCKSSEQWAIKRTVLGMIKEKFDSENIKIPYQQIEVHNGKKI